MLAQVERFQRDILNFPVPEKPTYLTGDAYGQKIKHLNEEMIELLAAHSVEGRQTRSWISSTSRSAR